MSRLVPNLLLPLQLPAQSAQRLRSPDGTTQTTFHSERRTGTVTVSVSAPNANHASVAITIVKSGGEAPPPTGDTGTIWGYVCQDGKAVRKAKVTLTGSGAPPSTTTNDRGK